MTPVSVEAAILITSVGSEAGRELAQSLAPLAGRARVIGTNLLPDAPGLFQCDAAYLVPPTAELGAFRARLEEIIAAEAPRLVFAGRDEDLELLATFAAEPRHAGIRFLVPPLPLVPVCNDKYRTAAFAREHGLPFAETAFGPDEVWALVARHGLPVIAKPRRIGHASKDVYLMTAREQVEIALAEDRFVFQELLPSGLMARTAARWRADLGIPIGWALEDEAHTINMAIGRDGQLLGAMVTETERKGPAMIRSRAEDNPAVADVGAAYAAAMARQGYRGSLNIQGKVVAGRGFVVFEINGRVAGSATTRTMAGFNLPLTLACHYLWDEAVPGPATALSETPEVRRELSSFGMPRQGIADLRRHGRWSRPGR